MRYGIRLAMFAVAGFAVGAAGVPITDWPFWAILISFIGAANGNADIADAFIAARDRCRFYYG